MKEEIIQKLQIIVKELTSKNIQVQIDIPSDLLHGDFTTNVAFQVGKLLKISPREAAEKVLIELHKKSILFFENTEVAGPGFINFYLSKDYLVSSAQEIVKHPDQAGKSDALKNKKIMVEFAHPNTHKEMHIGHMRTLITGESITRILASQEAILFRANYQGDIGPHVAKAMVGIQELMKKKKLSFQNIMKWTNKDKAHFLGEGYAEGNRLYEDATWKKEINLMNSFLYQKVEEANITSPFGLEAQEKIWKLYEETHQWSLDYYEEFYKRFYTHFDRLFMERDMVKKGKDIVLKNIGKVFTQDVDGSVIFKGELYGLHTRVFITQSGNPTYEGKEMGNAFAEWDAFPFDRKIHVVASEQIGYFKVVIKALELLNPQKFEGKQYHLAMGMVQFTDRKMSSRTGDIITVDDLLDEVKNAGKELMKEGNLDPKDMDTILEKVTIAAVKYSILKASTNQDAAFEIKTSVALNGNSGPYLQYTYVRTQSILDKNTNQQSDFDESKKVYQPENTELLLLRQLSQFQLIVEKAARELSPSTICTYLYELAKQFNLFYQTYRINDAKTSSEKTFRLLLTSASGIVLKQGLGLLGIVAPNRM